MGVIANKLAQKLTNKPKQKSLTEGKVGSLPVIKQGTQLGVGIGTSLGKQAINIGKSFLGAADLVSRGLGIGSQYQPAIQKLEKVKQQMYVDPFQKEQESGFGKVGTGIGVLVPYIATGGGISSVANATTKGITGFKGAGLARTLAGSAVEGLGGAGVTYGVSGGDLKQTKNAGLLTAGLSGVVRGAGEIAKATGLPSKLMGGVYKSDKKEIANIFDDIKTDKKTIPLRDWALNKGIKGNLQSQAKQVQKILKDSESKVISSAEAAKKTIKVDPNLKKFAQSIKTEFQDIGRGEVAKQADEFLKSVKGNNVSVKSAIMFRRLLDNTLRTKSSFNRPAIADNISYWAEDLRGAINSIDEIGAINKDYALAIKAREALIKAATSLNNQKALGALEAYALGGGIATGLSAPAIATVLAKRAVQSPRITSNLAQALKNTQASKTGTTIRTLIGGATASQANKLRQER